MAERPLLSERYRMPARVACVFAAYFLYRWMGDRELFPGLVVGIGLVLVGWAVIDEMMLARADRPSWRVAAVGLGVAFLGLGTFLSLR